MYDKDILNDVKVASPCSVPWDSMSGDDRIRHCGQCQMNVYNLSGMTTQDAEQLLGSASQGRMCIRFYRRKDGTIMTDDCPVALKKIRDRIRAAWVTSVLFVAGLMIGPIAAQQMFGAPMATAGEMVPRTMRVIDESVRRNYFSTLITSVLFLKLGIPYLTRHHWWRNFWVEASFSIAFLVGLVVDCACKILWPGVRWTSGDGFLEWLVTGLIFGLSCLLTTAIFRASQPMSGDAESKRT